MRRRFVVLLTFLALLPAQAQDYAQVRPGVRFQFPLDHGAHEKFRTEWWYVTGWLQAQDGREFGFQVTFFRSHPPGADQNPSRFAARQVLFAHAALSDPTAARLLHGERAARTGFGIAEASATDADVVLRDWFLQRGADDRWTTRVATDEFALSLQFTPTQPVMLQGDNGFSRKGPKPEQASHYYSVPQLEISGTLQRDNSEIPVSGKAWLDREWSSSYLAPEAQGWDWTGLNFDDGSALMAFRIRGHDGGTVWAGGSFRRADGSQTVFRPEDLEFQTVRSWTSPDTQAAYPVEQVLTIRLPEGTRRLALKPLFDAQELDSRASGLPVYWEGAVKTEGGRGYLELTGYAAKLRM